jgi:GAF domain-containing protein
MDKRAVYTELAEQFSALIVGETDLIANAANLAALIHHELPDLNWTGFYFARGKQLVLGPFQGRIACIRIPWGLGVCGTAAARAAAVVVPNVHAFPGYIACDAVTESELVVPLLRDGNVLGVLDLDSPKLARFDEDDRAGCEQLAAQLVAHHPDWR